MCAIEKGATDAVDGSSQAIPSQQAPPSTIQSIRAAVVAILKDKKVRGIVQILLSLGLLVWLFNRIGLHAILDTLAGIKWTWYIPAFLLFMLNVVLRAYRWHILLSTLHDRAPLRQLVYLYFLGFFFNNFIPSGFGGDVIKVIDLRQKHGHGAEALSSVIMDRTVGLLGSALIAVAALVWNGVQTTINEETGGGVALPPALLYATALITLGIPVGFLLIRSIDLLGLLCRYLPFTRKLTDNQKLQRLVNTVHRYPVSTLLKALCVSLPFTLDLIASQFFIARALSVDVPFYVFPLFVPIIGIINVLPISFNGLGMREGTYQFLFTPIGVPAASAITMSLAFYFLRVSAGLIGGALYALKSIHGIAQPAKRSSEEPS